MNATCDDGSPPGAINLGINETIKCTFENYKTNAVIGNIAVNETGYVLANTQNNLLYDINGT